jgi:hypothetical protein
MEFGIDMKSHVVRLGDGTAIVENSSVGKTVSHET